MTLNRKSRGSVSRAFAYLKKSQDKEFLEKTRERARKYQERKKKKVNKRCIDCGKLISPQSTKCRDCSIKQHHKEYLKYQKRYNQANKHALKKEQTQRKPHH